MGRAVGADQPGAVHREAHRQVLDRDIVDDLVVSALEERRVNRAKRLVAVGGEAGGEGHTMLFSDADVEHPLRKARPDLVEPGPRGHCGGDRHHLVVALHFVAKRFCEHRGIGRRSAAGPLVLLARDDVELDHAVIFVGRAFGRGIALALLGHDVDEHRPDVGVADIFKDFDQRTDVMAVDRPDVIKAQFLEQCPAGHPAAGIFLGLARPVVDPVRHHPGDLLRHPPRREIFVRADQARKRVAQASDRRRDRHVVIVENDDQPVAGISGVVHRLIGHSGAHRAVADDRDRAARIARQLVGHRKTQRSGDRGRTVRRAERVVFALRPAGEAAQPPALAKRADAIATAGDDLVRISLVADVPDQFVGRRVEHIMDRDGQLDHAEPGPKMTARLRHRGNHFGTQLVGEGRQLLLIQRAQIGGKRDAVEQWGGRAVAHQAAPYALARALSPDALGTPGALSWDRSRRKCRALRSLGGSG